MTGSDVAGLVVLVLCLVLIGMLVVLVPRGAYAGGRDRRARGRERSGWLDVLFPRFGWLKVLLPRSTERSHHPNDDHHTQSGHHGGGHSGHHAAWSQGEHHGWGSSDGGHHGGGFSEGGGHQG